MPTPDGGFTKFPEPPAVQELIESQFGEKVAPAIVPIFCRLPRPSKFKSVWAAAGIDDAAKNNTRRNAIAGPNEERCVISTSFAVVFVLRLAVCILAHAGFGFTAINRLEADLGEVPGLVRALEMCE